MRNRKRVPTLVLHPRSMLAFPSVPLVQCDCRCPPRPPQPASLLDRVFRSLGIQTNSQDSQEQKDADLEVPPPPPPPPPPQFVDSGDIGSVVGRPKWMLNLPRRKKSETDQKQEESGALLSELKQKLSRGAGLKHVERTTVKPRIQSEQLVDVRSKFKKTPTIAEDIRTKIQSDMAHINALNAKYVELQHKTALEQAGRLEQIGEQLAKAKQNLAAYLNNATISEQDKSKYLGLLRSRTTRFKKSVRS